VAISDISMPSFAAVRPGRELRVGRAFLPRHVHAAAYAAVVLAGSYEECGNHGRFRVRAGDVLLHEAFDAHLDRISPQGATILNLELPIVPMAFAAGRVSDVDAIARAAERDSLAAVAMLLAQLRTISPLVEDWPDVLAKEIVRDQSCRLDRWSQGHGLAPETISRGFGRVFGTTAASFRAEARARRAFEQIVRTNAPLVDIAANSGFADQAHMTRAVRALTGAPANSWRSRSISFKSIAEESRLLAE
jgi:AraC-like DNA-binding protein